MPDLVWYVKSGTLPPHESAPHKNHHYPPIKRPGHPYPPPQDQEHPSIFWTTVIVGIIHCLFEGSVK